LTGKIGSVGATVRQPLSFSTWSIRWELKLPEKRYWNYSKTAVFSGGREKNRMMRSSSN